MSKKKVKNSFFALKEVDSFYNSRILIYNTTDDLKKKIITKFKKNNFDNITTVATIEKFSLLTKRNKYDLIIFDLRIKNSNQHYYDHVKEIRINDSDVAIITISDNQFDIKKHLKYSVSNNFKIPFDTTDLFTASKKAIGNKISHEIGMQFFDALFGMQMCTHRDLHQRTFDHVIRTTKIYGKFLLYCYNKKLLTLTSWVLKNCLMASMVHDIGKLLLMHGLLYKEGKLSEFEYQQLKRHPWHSITALLGGQDIEFFAKVDEPIKVVSGYKERNLGDLVQSWIFNTDEKNGIVFEDIDNFFSNMQNKPSVHSLNEDLLYIVFRHHDGLKESYHTEEELNLFGKILNRKIRPRLSANSTLDLVTNALSICDVYDALLDLKRDYRKSSYNKFFALFLLYTEMKRSKFFPKLIELFIKFIIENEDFDESNPFADSKNSNLAYKAIKNIYLSFEITEKNEWDFYNFITENVDKFEKYSAKKDHPELQKLRVKWNNYFKKCKKSMLDKFISELQKANLMNKPYKNLTKQEKQTFYLLYEFYYSYSSVYKQKLLIEFMVDAVIDPELNHKTKEKLSDLIKNEEIRSRRDIEKVFLKEGYKRHNVFETFKYYDNDILINELNDFIRKHT